MNNDCKDVTLNQVNIFNRESHPLRILLSNPFQEYISGLKMIPVEVFVFNNSLRKVFVNTENLRVVDSSLLSDAEKCAQYVVDNGISILYAQGMRSLLYFSKVRKYCRRSNVKIIVNCHSPRLWDSAWRSLLFILCAGFLSDRMVFLVERTRKKWRWLCEVLRLKTFHVPNPVDISRFPSNVIRDRDCIVLGNVGIINRRKRQDVIIECVAELRKDGYNVYARFAGNVIKGDEMYINSLQERAVELGIQAYISFDGSIPYDNVPRWLENIDIYICPSDAEVMPFSILEAMASGLPVVAHDIAGIHEEVVNGENGVLVVDDSIEEYVKACKLILDKKLCERMGSRSRAILQKDFTLETYAERMKRVFLSFDE